MLRNALRRSFCILMVPITALSFVAIACSNDDGDDLEFRSRLLANEGEATEEAAKKPPVVSFQIAADRTAPELADPIRLVADGKPIDIGTLSSIAHAGPTVADVDGDGDRDLLVGDFPGHFWFFKNNGTDQQPQYTSVGKLQAGGVDAKTPVY